MAPLTGIPMWYGPGGAGPPRPTRQPASREARDSGSTRAAGLGVRTTGIAAGCAMSRTGSGSDGRLAPALRWAGTPMCDSETRPVPEAANWWILETTARSYESRRRCVSGRAQSRCRRGKGRAQSRRRCGRCQLSYSYEWPALSLLRIPTLDLALLLRHPTATSSRPGHAS
jgi:hypothetical protein